MNDTLRVLIEVGDGVTRIGPDDVVFIPSDTEHGLRTPNGGRWVAIWPLQSRQPGPRYR